MLGFAAAKGGIARAARASERGRRSLVRRHIVEGRECDENPSFFCAAAFLPFSLGPVWSFGGVDQSWAIERAKFFSSVLDEGKSHIIIDFGSLSGTTSGHQTLEYVRQQLDSREGSGEAGTWKGHLLPQRENFKAG